MNTLGLSGLSTSLPFKRKEFPNLSSREYNILQGFDAAAALVGSQGVIAAAAEERFTGQKATGAFPIKAIRYCLKAGHLAPGQVDLIAHGFSYEPHRKLFETSPESERQYAEVFSPEIQKQLLEQYFPGADWGKKFVPVPHHIAHAASSYYLSGFDRALILISDGMGEVESMTVLVGEGLDLQVLTRVPAFHSLGTLYGVFTMYLGFYMNSDEYKVMGLAPYGNPERYLGRMREFVSFKDDGTYTIPLFARNVTPEQRETHAGVLEFLAREFGPPREPEAELTQRDKDVAAALQALLQSCQLHVLRHFRKETGQKNLCLAGGVALNCSVNGAIRRSGLFERMFVQPAAGDDGCALGAALYAQRLYWPGFKTTRISVPLWGPEFTDDEIRSAIEGSESCEAIEMESFDEVCREVAARLGRGEIVAWFQGRMEFGPRALGSRSILADPRDPTMRERINSLVKKREGFRPFAPVVTDEAAARLFELTPGDEATYAHMLYVTPVRKEYRERLPATTHVDGSARVQTVSQKANPRLWQLLNEFARSSGEPVLLNTSFNVRGQPIVCTPQEAIETFLTAKLDLLVMGNFLVVPRQTAIKEETESGDSFVESEEDWQKLVNNLEPVALPFPKKTSARSEASVASTAAEAMPKEIINRLQVLNGGGIRELLLAGFATYLARITGSSSFHLGFSEAGLKISGAPSVVQPLHIELDLTRGFDCASESVRTELKKLRSHNRHGHDLRHQCPVSNDSPAQNEVGFPVLVEFTENGLSSPQMEAGTELKLEIDNEGTHYRWTFDENILDQATVSSINRQFLTLLQAVIKAPAEPLAKALLLSEAERKRVLVDWNDTSLQVQPACIHELFEAQARRTPNALALAYEEREMTYRELDQQATALAARLQELGVKPEVLVGICMEVSIEMIVALLGVLKAGGAYVPLDPGYPKDRVAFMLEDAQVKVLVTQQTLLEFLPKTSAAILCIDGPLPESKGAETAGPSGARPENLAYVIYTSGSTGKPKGVMVMHVNVVNFFAGMDQRLGADSAGVWLAVTSISFDISVLELFWTLTRGFKVVLQRKETHSASSRPSRASSGKRPSGFSLLYFASNESEPHPQKYRLLLEGAKFADTHGFEAVWTPERHFHAFGGLYPNPSVTSAAIAAITRRVQIRAGSVVLPLHNPIRVAEEWAVVDNLSHGRVGISFASGWQINDFILAPENYGARKEIMVRDLERIRKLWRGESVDMPGGNGKSVSLKLYPRPIQAELPLWVTASGNPETFRLAGELGANLLTHLLGQSLEELEQKIAAYRAAWKENHHPGEGRITLMLHTFVGEDMERVREIVRGPFTQYLLSSIDLIKNDPWAFSTFKTPAGAPGGNGHPSPARFSEEEQKALAEHAFKRYFQTSGLFGTPEHCLGMVNRVSGMGVDEIACLIDFGVAEDLVLASLEQLNALRESAQRSSLVSAKNDYSVAAQIRRHGVTHMQCTPSLASMLAEEPKALEALGSLKKLLLGGEALPPGLPQRLNVRGDLLNMYGPTETTIWSTNDVVSPGESLVSIGKPIANTEIYIVDPNLEPTPPGVAGELLIGGAGVVRGYLHRAELTAEKFIPNPFKPGPGARLYKTGDLARFLPDGRIEFLGRLDHQVKLRGFRIELGEVESALCNHPAIKECVAIVREDEPGDKRLTAYLIYHSQPESAAALREFLKSKLPDYMIPSAFVPLEVFPLTPNGKIDRRALPAPAENAEAEKPAPAASPTEEKIATLYGELLGIKVVTRTANFFELGANSLLATQLIARLRETTQADLPLRVAFEYPTVESLARALDERAPAQANGQSTSQRPITRRKDPEQMPLSFAQQRLWFLHQLEPGLHYNDHFDLRLKGPLDSGILERALSEIVRRHETLRSSFNPADGSPVLQVAPFSALLLPLHDLSGEADPEREALRLAIQQGRQPFDLERGPLFRAGLLRLAPGEHVLALTFHHIIIDGWSRGVLLRELLALYTAFLSKKQAALNELPIQYSDYAAWQQQWLEDESMQQHLRYWKAQLAGAPSLIELPLDHARPATQSFKGARHALELDKKTVDALIALGHRHDSTLFMVLLAAFQTILARWSGRTDIVVGSPIANRVRPELEPLIGNFLNTLVLRGNLAGDPTFAELITRARATALEAYAHQDFPFEKLVAELQPARDQSYSPVFQVMLVLQNTPRPTESTGGLEISPFEIDTGVAKLDLTLHLEQGAAGCSGWIEYSTELFEAPTIAHFSNAFKDLLEAIVTRPGQRLSQLLTQFDLNGKKNGSAPDDPEPLVPPMRLSSPDSPDAEQSGGGDSSRTLVERELGRIWSEVLGRQNIGMDESVFDLGGHSLLITRILARIRKRFGVEVPIQAMFETPSLGAIASRIETELQNAERGEVHTVV